MAVMDADERLEIHPRSKGYPPGIISDRSINIQQCSCSYCSLILREPMQNQCGHRFCASCLAQVSQDSSDVLCKPCKREGQGRDSQTKVDIESAIPDKGIARDMARLAARCVECSWCGTFAQYKEHENTCRADDSSESGLDDSFEIVDPQDTEPDTNVKQQNEAIWENRHVHEWIITEFDKKSHEAEKGFMPAIFSEPFYTDDGYKIGACAYLNGDGMAKGRYLSLFLVIYKGNNDDRLVWPFNKKITLVLLDQSGDNHVKDAFRPDPTSASFKKPIGLKNLPSGLSIFCPLSDLKNHQSGFVKNKTLRLQMIVG